MRSIYLLLVLIISGSCATQHIYMSVIEPAPVDIPPDIKKVAVIDRSQPSDESKIDKVDKVLSLESKELDKEGAKESILGLENELMKNDRFTEIKMVNINLKTTGAGVFPAALSWDMVEKICNENSVDAVFSLELWASLKTTF